MEVNSNIMELIREGKVKGVQFTDSDGDIFIYDFDTKHAPECKDAELGSYSVKLITPKFNDKEKSCLRSMLDKFDKRVNYIVRRDSGNGQYNIFFGLDHGKSYVILQSPDTMFNELILDRKYDPTSIRDSLSN